MVKIECYIEEYVNGKGALCARLREKENNRHVIIQGDGQIKAHLLRFLSAAKEYSETMPTVFDRDGTDIVAVRGIVEKEDEAEIEVSLNAIGAGYLFE